MLTAVAMVGLVALTGCGGDDDDAGAVARPPSPSTTEASLPGTTTAGVPSTTPATTATSALSPSSGPTTTRAGAQPSRPGPVEGVSIDYPPGWGPSGQQQATAFANGATCGAALIVDRALPPNAGPGAQVEQSFVQFCWRGLDGRTLPEFMAATYGSAGGFQATTLAGRPAFVSRAGTSSTYFVDAPARRYQIISGVVATPALEATRLAEVQRILASVSLSN